MIRNLFNIEGNIDTNPSIQNEPKLTKFSAWEAFIPVKPHAFVNYPIKSYVSHPKFTVFFTIIMGSQIIVYDLSFIHELQDAMHLVIHNYQEVSNTVGESLQKTGDLFNKLFNNNSNINIPKSKEAFNIFKPTVLNYLPKPELNGLRDTVVNWPRPYMRPFIYPGLNINLNNIPYLGVGLALFTIIYTSALDFGVRVWNEYSGIFDYLFSKLSINNICNKFKTVYNNIKCTNKNFYDSCKKTYNKIWNEEYINSMIENYQRDFLLYPTWINTNTDLFYNLQNQINVIRFYAQDFIQDLIPGNVGPLNNFIIGRSFTINWQNSVPIITISNMPRNSYITLPNRGELDTLYNSYQDIFFQDILDDYVLQEHTFDLRVNYGNNLLSDNYPDLGNYYHLSIHNFSVNWGALHYFILFLQMEVESMENARENLIHGGLNAEIFTHNGNLAQFWIVFDFNHLLNLYPDFDIQLQRKKAVLDFLIQIMNYMDSNS